MAKLRAGIGAKASILTRLIKPLQIVDEGNHQNHRSDVVRARWYANEKGTVEDDANAQKLHGAARFVKIIEEEGPEGHIFTGQAPQDEAEKLEPKCSWVKSLARKLPYRDLKDGLVPLEKDDGMNDMDVYTSRPEFAAWSWEKFSGHLNASGKLLCTITRGQEQIKQHLKIWEQQSCIIYQP
jgi:hypothetical protein